MKETAERPSPEGEKLRAELDGELDALPEKFRHPILLHHFEGRTHDEGAALLGCTPSAFSMRLTRGRELLRERLVRRGAVLPAGLLVIQLTENVSGEAVSAAFVGTTAKAASLLAAGNAAAGALVSVHVTTLTQGALNMLFLAKMKVAAVLAAVVLAGSGAGLWAYRAGAEEKPTPPSTADKVKPSPQEKASYPVEKDGLSLTLTPNKAVFAEEEALEFTVTLKNVSEANFLLYDVHHICSAYSLYQYTFEKMGTGEKFGAFYQIEDERKIGVAHSQLLEPHQALDVILNLKGIQVQKDHKFTPGAYRLTVKVNLVQNPTDAKWKNPHWKGEIVSKPVAFEIAADNSGGVKTSESVVKDGLSVSVRPAKAVFSDKESVTFSVVFKNISGKPLALNCGIRNPLTLDPYDIIIESVETGRTWCEGTGLDGMPPEKWPAPQSLASGQAAEIKIKNLLPLKWLPIPPKSDSAEALKPGKYRVSMKTKIMSHPATDGGQVVWTGEITTKAAEFEIAQGKPNGEVITEEKAMELARQAAEKALDTAYAEYRKVNGPNNPTHEGSWYLPKPLITKHGADWRFEWNCYVPAGYSRVASVKVTVAGEVQVLHVDASYSSE